MGVVVSEVLGESPMILGGAGIVWLVAGVEAVVELRHRYDEVHGTYWLRQSALAIL